MADRCPACLEPGHRKQDCPQFAQASPELTETPSDAQDVVDGLSTRQRALHALIVRYAQHDTDCPMFHLHSHWSVYCGKPCNCGLMAALEECQFPAVAE